MSKLSWKKIRPSTAFKVETSKKEVVNRPSTASAKLNQSFVSPSEELHVESEFEQVTSGISFDDNEWTLDDDIKSDDAIVEAASNLIVNKIEEVVTLDHLIGIKNAFDRCKENETGALDLLQFKNVFRKLHGLRNINQHQITTLFKKIDVSSQGYINWDGFCTYMQLEYSEKEEALLRSKRTSFQLPATIKSSPHRESVVEATHVGEDTFITAGQDGMILFWNSSLQLKQTRQVECTLKKSKWITDFSLMLQYNKFIVTTGDRELQFHELLTFEGYCQISGLETVPLCLDYCFKDNSECLLLYGDSEGCVNIFIMKNVAELLRNWKKMPKVEGIPSVSADSVIALENVTFVRWKVHNDWVQQLKYFHSIRSVISCSADYNNSIVIGQTLGSTNVSLASKEKIKPNNAVPRRRFPADETIFKVNKGVKAFDFSKIKNVMASGGMDRLIRLWNPYVPTKPVGILRGHHTPIFYLCIVDEDNRLFSVSTDNTIKIWDVYEHTCLVTVRPKVHLVKGDLTAVHFNPLSSGMVLVTDHVALLQLKQKPLAMRITTTHKEGVTYCCYNSSFNHVITASERSAIKVWDIKTGVEVFEFSNVHDDSPITCMMVDVTGRRLITSGFDGKVKVWNYNNGHCLCTLQPSKNNREITCLEYFALNDNRYIVSVGWERRINLYSEDRDRVKPLMKWIDDIESRAHKEDVLSVGYSPPYILATSSYDGEILIWNVTTGLILNRLNSVPHNIKRNDVLEGKLAITKLLFLKTRCENKDSASLITNGPGQIHFWNIYGHKSPYAVFSTESESIITFLAVTSDDCLLVASDEKGFLTIWNVENYCTAGIESGPPKLYASWRAHVDSINCVCLVEVERCLMTCSVDGAVRVWTYNGCYVGTFGQPNKWCISDELTFGSNPMDDLDEPAQQVTVAQRDESHGKGTMIKKKEPIKQISPETVEELLNCKAFLDPRNQGKRLRHAKLDVTKKIGQSGHSIGYSAYKALRYYELEEVPSLTLK